MPRKPSMLKSASPQYVPGSIVQRVPTPSSDSFGAVGAINEIRCKNKECKNGFVNKNGQVHKCTLCGGSGWDFSLLDEQK